MRYVDKAEWKRTCILHDITTEPNDFMRRIHRRMPLILQREDEDQWLDCTANAFDRFQLLVKAFSADIMAAHEVSRRVNNPKYDAPECSAPLEVDAMMKNHSGVGIELTTKIGEK